MQFKNGLYRLIMLLLAISIFLQPTSYGANVAKKPVPMSIFVNDTALDTYDSVLKKNMPALVINNRTLMPLRKTFELFGLEIKWDSKNRIAETVNKEGKKIWLQVGNKYAKIGDEKIVLDVPARIIENRTYVPLAFIAKAAGFEATWDSKNNLVNIYTDGSEHLILSALPSDYSKEPGRLNNSIFFNGKDSKMIAVTESEFSFGEALKLLSEMLYIQTGDFTLSVNEPDLKIAVYEDQFMAMKRCNVVVNRSNSVFILEIRGMTEKEAVDFVKLFIR